MKRIHSGVIPNSECPKCGAPLAVRDKRNPQQYAKHIQFVGCTMYHVTGCNYVAQVTAEIEQKMEEEWAKFEALPAEF